MSTAMRFPTQRANAKSARRLKVEQSVAHTLLAYAYSDEDLNRQATARHLVTAYQRRFSGQQRISGLVRDEVWRNGKLEFLVVCDGAIPAFGALASKRCEYPLIVYYAHIDDDRLGPWCYSAGKEVMLDSPDDEERGIFEEIIQRDAGIIVPSPIERLFLEQTTR